MIACFQDLYRFGGQGLLAVKWTARDGMHQAEGNDRDNQDDDHHVE